MTDTETEPTDIEQEPTEAPDSPEEPDEAPPEPLQPSEVYDREEATSSVVLHTPKGALTLRPNQTELDEVQKQALVAIGIDTRADPAVIPQVRPFIHMCQVRGLDPWAREAYLIGRGKGQYRKFTMQTGIDGYRKIAATTGQFIRVKDTLWTGNDDDDRSWRTDASGVERRRWFDQWPASRGNPGAAKVVVEHYDDYGNVVTTEAVADWGMYAPYSDLYEGGRGGQQRTKVIDPDTGKPVQVLNDMWTKGGPHMLAKCAEALAYRRAFPARMSGFYTNEEMHRADQAENDRIEADRRKARQAAYVAAQQASGPLVPPPADEPEQTPRKPPSNVMGSVVDGLADSMAASVEAQAPADQAEPADDEHPAPDTPKAPGDMLGALRAELAFQAEALGQTVERLAQRQVRAVRRNLDAFTAEDYAPVVFGLRDAVAGALAQSDGALADRYVSLYEDDPRAVVDVGALTGQQVSSTGHQVSDGTHPFKDSGEYGLCSECGQDENDEAHS